MSYIKLIPASESAATYGRLTLEVNREFQNSKKALNYIVDNIVGADDRLVLPEIHVVRSIDLDGWYIKSSKVIPANGLRPMDFFEFKQIDQTNREVYLINLEEGGEVYIWRTEHGTLALDYDAEAWITNIDSIPGGVEGLSQKEAYGKYIRQSVWNYQNVIHYWRRRVFPSL